MRTWKLAAAGLLLLAAAGRNAAAMPTESARAAPAERRPKTRPAEKRHADRESRFTGEPISLDLKDADLKDVLKTFAELGKVNIAIDPEVRGSVTIRLHDVPWDQALDVILATNGYGFVLEGNILRVGLPAKLAKSD